MTSTLATNFVNTGLGRKHHLETDADGKPLQGQVPKTYEYYSGAGNVSIVPQGKDVFYASNLATGVLTLNLTSTPNYYNMIGRQITVYVAPAAANNVIVDITGGGRAFNLTGDAGDQATITPGGTATFHFLDNRTVCLITASSNTTIA